MNTKNLIGVLEEICELAINNQAPYYVSEDMIMKIKDEVIKRLEEVEELKKEITHLRGVCDLLGDKDM